MNTPPNSPPRDEHEPPKTPNNLTQEEDDPVPDQFQSHHLSSQDQTLEVAQDHQIEEIPQLDPSQNQPQQEPEPEEEQEPEEEEGKKVSDQGAEQEDDLPQQLGMSLSIQNPLPSPSIAPRRHNKRKKGHLKKFQAIEKKAQTLSEKLNPIPFVPSKTLDFPKYETLLKRLGLWDFVHIEFDTGIRIDLLAQLIASYDLKARGSYVNDFRIMVNRADLGRAFKIPVKKEKTNVAWSETVDLDSEEFSEDSLMFLEDFLNNWVLLHEDTWIMPSEVLNWTRVIKDGHPDKVDWAGLIWFMAEKELMQGQQLGDCYYASHLQYLIKSQREEVFREGPKMDEEVEIKDDEDGGGGDTKIDALGDLKIDAVDVSREQDNFVLKEHKLELTLGQDMVEKVKDKDKDKDEDEDEDAMDVEQCKEVGEEENGQWIFDGKNSVGEHFLQRCNLEEGPSLISEEVGNQEEIDHEEEEEEEEGEETEDGFNLAPNGHENLEGDGLTGNLLQGMETTQVPFSLPGHFCDQSAMELLASKTETHTISGGPSTFSMGNKREMEHNHDISHHTLNGSNKRLRTDDLWDHKSSDFGMCMDQMQHLMGKARMLHAAKEQAFEDVAMNQQILLNEVQKRDGVIDHLHKAKIEELQKKDGEIYRLERELFVMGSLLEGYRKALKEKQKEFFEYRQQFPHREESLYRDAGSGGVVLTVLELEKQRQKRKEEYRMNILMEEQKAKDSEERCKSQVVMLDKKLTDLENKVKLLQELYERRKASRIQVVSQKNDELLATSSSEKTEIQEEEEKEQGCEEEVTVEDEQGCEKEVTVEDEQGCEKEVTVEDEQGCEKEEVTVEET